MIFVGQRFEPRQKLKNSNDGPPHGGGSQRCSHVSQRGTEILVATTIDLDGQSKDIFCMSCVRIKFYP
jgi:hypothetical protein